VQGSILQMLHLINLTTPRCNAFLLHLRLQWSQGYLCRREFWKKKQGISFSAAPHR